jgi:hypothetical protein
MPKRENVEKYDNQVIKKWSFKHSLTELYCIQPHSKRIAFYMDSFNQRLIYGFNYSLSVKGIFFSVYLNAKVCIKTFRSN